MDRIGVALLLALLSPACVDAADSGDADGDRPAGPAILGDDDKADGVPGVELVARIGTAAPVDGTLTTATPRIAFAFYATAGSTIAVEVTRTGSATGLDTVLRVHGVRDDAGVYTSQLVEDDNAGYGNLSKITGLTAPSTGFYLAEVAAKTPGALATGKKVRVALTCNGTCDSAEPIAPAGLDVRWVERSAEYRAAALQAYAGARARLASVATAGLPARWAVVLDIDETTLSNVSYQRARAELGVGYSTASFAAWVARQAAPAMPGVREFLADVRARGGNVVLVSNRKAVGECTPTKANLIEQGINADLVLCRAGASDKNPRFASIENGTAGALPAMPVVMFVGDNIQDFPGLDQDVNADDDAAFADFGARFVVLPNPMYGSWESR